MEVGSDGSFEWECVEPGECRVRIAEEEPGAEKPRAIKVRAGGRAVPPEGRFPLGSGETVDLQVELEG
jgi:hypothetical protein